jgi:hypothetical protein
MESKISQAKQKAARQAGVPDTHSLPDNREIEDALRTYRAFYQQGEHQAVLRHLREQALHLMDLFEAFTPYLVGSVLTGTAGATPILICICFVTAPRMWKFFCSTTILRTKRACVASA